MNHNISYFFSYFVYVYVSYFVYDGHKYMWKMSVVC